MALLRQQGPAAPSTQPSSPPNPCPLPPATQHAGGVPYDALAELGAYSALHASLHAFMRGLPAEQV